MSFPHQYSHKQNIENSGVRVKNKGTLINTLSSTAPEVIPSYSSWKSVTEHLIISVIYYFSDLVSQW